MGEGESPAHAHRYPYRLGINGTVCGFGLKKAFDVCSHEILLAKLEKMGIQNVALKWFKNYLSGRTQQVDINGQLSESRNLDISVIQGSILGPILFLCYINDFWTATNLFSALFADDTTCCGKGKKLDELVLFVNQELQKIATWFRANKMAVNTSKTKYIIFRTRGKQINPRDCHLVYNGNEVGVPEDPNLVYEIERIHNEGETITINVPLFKKLRDIIFLGGGESLYEPF